MWLNNQPNGIVYAGKVAYSYKGKREGDLVIADGTISIAAQAFMNSSGGSSNFVSVKMPNSLIKIGNSAFYKCSNIEKISIPSSVTTIGESAFAHCYSLSSITIPKNVNYIGEYAFGGRGKLESITVEKDNVYYDSRNDCNALIETASNTLLRGCKNTQIPNNITKIGDFAFDYCNNLTNIDIPQSVKEIGAGAFYSCVNLITITIPENVNIIPYHTFSYCNSLTSIKIPDTISEIGEGAFFECKSLDSINIPKKLSIIRKSTFYKCSKLNSIIIPNDVTDIEDIAFYGCSELNTVIIGNNTKYVRIKAFANCPKLVNVFCYSETVPKTVADSFLDSNIESASLHVIESSINDYKTSYPWMNFKEIVAITDNDPKPTWIKTTESVDHNKGILFDLNGRKVDYPHNGIFIKNGKKLIIK